MFKGLGSAISGDIHPAFQGQCKSFLQLASCFLLLKDKLSCVFCSLIDRFNIAMLRDNFIGQTSEKTHPVLEIFPTPGGTGRILVLNGDKHSMFLLMIEELQDF